MRKLLGLLVALVLACDVGVAVLPAGAASAPASVAAARARPRRRTARSRPRRRTARRSVRRVCRRVGRRRRCAPAGPAAPSRPQMGPPPSQTLVFPVQAPVNYGDTFGACRALNGNPCGRSHQGQDVFAAKGSPVVAAHDGIVTRAAWSALGGNTITLLHDSGWSTMYVHLNNDNPGTDDARGTPWPANIRAGVFVRAGDLIAWSGDSGNAEGTLPHLHFELHQPPAGSGPGVNSYALLRTAQRHP